MNWILIVVVYSLSYASPSVTSVLMDSEKACHAAGAKAVAELPHKGNVVKFVCSRK